MKRWGALAVLLLLATAPSLWASGGFGAAPGDVVTPAAVNRAWLLLCSFLIFAMQAGFALMETGLTRAKNVAHTMAMNVVIFALSTFGFWVCGFALLSGNIGNLAHLGSGDVLNQEVSISIGGHEFGLFGARGFFLSGLSLDAGVLALFLFQLMFLDTAATIPTGALAERWRFLAFALFGLFVGMILYPVYGNWVWGHGWLARLGSNFGLGHGHVDFAGSSVVHMTGGLIGLVGTWLVGPRIGKFKPDGSPNPLPAHNIPMYMLGTLLLAFGWFGFNAGGAPVATDTNVPRIAVNTVLSSAAGALASMVYLWVRFGKPDPSFICNGTLAGLVAITAGCAYVAPWAAFVIGGFAGILVVWSALFLERSAWIDDPVGAISVHGTCGLWGVLAVGLFADGTYAPVENFNGVAGHVTGLFYGDGSQLVAQCVGAVANLLWVMPMTYGFFRLTSRLVGNRVSPPVEMQGLDVPELGALGYITQDPKTPENRVVIQRLPEPRAAVVPPPDVKRFTVVVEGVDLEVLTRLWSDLCQVSDRPPAGEFLAVYPHMTTMQGNRFRFRGGDPQEVRSNLERLLQQHSPGRMVRTRLEL